MGEYMFLCSYGSGNIVFQVFDSQASSSFQEGHFTMTFDIAFSHAVININKFNYSS